MLAKTFYIMKIHTDNMCLNVSDMFEVICKHHAHLGISMHNSRESFKKIFSCINVLYLYISVYITYYTFYRAMQSLCKVP